MIYVSILMKYIFLYWNFIGRSGNGQLHCATNKTNGSHCQEISGKSFFRYLTLSDTPFPIKGLIYMFKSRVHTWPETMSAHNQILDLLIIGTQNFVRVSSIQGRKCVGGMSPDKNN